MQLWGHLAGAGCGGAAREGVAARCLRLLCCDSALPCSAFWHCRGKDVLSFVLGCIHGARSPVLLPYCAGCVRAACNLLNAWSEQPALLPEPK